MNEFCPNCGGTTERSHQQHFDGGEYDESLPDVEVLNIILACEKCGYGWNCMGTKKLNS